MTNTKTQRHKGTKKAGINKPLFAGFLCAFVPLCLCVLTTAIPAQAKSKFDPKSADQFVCNTNLGRTAEAIARSRYNRQQRPFALSSFNESQTVDISNVAILQDDGTVLTAPNNVDVANSSIAFTPVQQGLTLRYSVLAGAAAFDEGAGSAAAVSLGDDDTAQISLPFSFSFYGTSYSAVFLNSDGNLTFNAGDNASTVRSLGRVTSGPPRVAPFFNDLNPVGAARISVEKLSNRVLFTWTDVGEWSQTGSKGKNTFQVILQSDGTIRFNYKSLDATSAVVAIAPGNVVRTGPPFSSNEISLIDFSLRSGSPVVLPGAIAEVFATTQELDLVQASRIFYETHPDVYDGLVFFSDFNLVLSDGFAFAVPLRNDIRGIMSGSDTNYDFGAEFGSERRLSVVVNMGDLSRYPTDPRQQFLGTNNPLSVLGQEFGHRWLAYLDIDSVSLLGRDDAHWSFLHNTLGSVMEGNEIQDLGGGRFRTVGATVRYSPLDQYAMGLRAASDVPPWFVVDNPALPGPFPPGFPARCRNLDELPGCAPFIGVPITGNRHDVSINDIISAVGPRVPGSDVATKNFRVAFVLVTQRGLTWRSSSLDTLAKFRTEWESFFSDAVDGRGTMATDLQYTRPQITAVSPARGPVSGATPITLTGTGLSLASGVTIGGLPATILFRNKTVLVVESPVHGPGPVPLVVRSSDGQSVTLDPGFTYFSPGQTEVRVNIPANGSRYIPTTGEDASARVGYATVDGAFGMSAIRSGSASEVNSEVAIPAATIGTAFRTYIERSDRTSTGFAIVNTAATTASISLTLSNGNQTTISLAARSQKSQFIHELFSDLGTSFRGTLLMTSNVPIAVVALRGTFNQDNEFIMAALPLSSATSGFAAAGITAFPQIADGGGYSTELVLLNPGASTISGTVEFSSSVATDRGSSTRFSYGIPAGGAWTLRTEGAGTAAQLGYATVSPDSGNLAPVGTALLRHATGGNLNFETGVQATRPITRGLIFGSRDATHRPVLAIVNTGAAAVLRLTAYRQDPTSVVTTRTTSLAANAYRAEFLDELMPQLPAVFQGTVVIESDSPVHILTMQTVTSVSGAFLMNAMPVIDLNQPPASTTSYFPQIVDGGGFTTEFMLFSPTAGTLRLRFFAPDGEPFAVPVQ